MRRAIYRPRPIALFTAGVRAGPRGDGSAHAYLYFLRFIIECTTCVHLSIYRIYTRARENGQNGRNGTERAEHDQKKSPVYPL